jgi:hypothetical protein
MEAFAHDHLSIIPLLKEKFKEKKLADRQHSHSPATEVSPSSSSSPSTSSTSPLHPSSQGLASVGLPEDILNPMLGTAAGHGDVHLVERLIKGGAKVDHSDYDKRVLYLSPHVHLLLYLLLLALFILVSSPNISCRFSVRLLHTLQLLKVTCLLSNSYTPTVLICWQKTVLESPLFKRL